MNFLRLSGAKIGSLNKLVNYIIKEYAKNFSTTVIYDRKEDLKEDSDKRKKIVDHGEIQGIEDEFIISSITSSNYSIDLNDVLTRARNGFVIVIDTDTK